MLFGHNQNKTVRYGLLYNWFAVVDANFCPSNWSVISYSDITSIVTYYGGATVAGGHLKKEGLFGWSSPNTGADNSSNFSLFGGGARNSEGSFRVLKQDGYYWTNSEDSTYYAWDYIVYYNSAAINVQPYSLKVCGFYTRLKYTGSGNPGAQLVDYDKNIYNIININGNYYTKENWKCTHLNNGTNIPEVTNDTDWENMTTKALCAPQNNWNYV